MVEALKKELEELDNQEQPVEETQETPEPEVVEEKPEEEAKEEAPPQEDEELKKKQEAYKERLQKRKAEEERKKEEQARQEELRKQADETFTKEKAEKDRMAFLESAAQQMMYNQQISRAKQELNAFEKEFKEAYPDYETKLNDATEFLKMNLTSRGMSEADALATIEREKIMHADAAVRNGKDPVEEIYKEAQRVNSIVDEFAKKRGFVKPEPQADLGKVKQMTRPNAMNGGKGSSGVKSELTDEDNYDMNDMNLGQMLNAFREGQI